ncbi:Transcriptional regulator with XRE-family HTH domain OS=Castellaniella defragrans OX=75697 GN=HNR28_001592 PE=4 SV=1 [Castellaniella defragrans]
MHEFPQRLRLLRRRHRLTLEQLAQRSNLTRSYLSKLERGVSEPSISTVLKLAGAYGVDVSELIGAANTDEGNVSVVRVAERMPLDRASNVSGYRYEALAGRRLACSMNPFIVYPPQAGEGTPAVFPHDGEEFMFVLKGAVSITIQGKAYALEEGDTIYFDSTLPHRVLSVGGGEAQVLVVATAAGVEASSSK